MGVGGRVSLPAGKEGSIAVALSGGSPVCLPPLIPSTASAERSASRAERDDAKGAQRVRTAGRIKSVVKNLPENDRFSRFAVQRFWILVMVLPPRSPRLRGINCCEDFEVAAFAEDAAQHSREGEHELAVRDVVADGGGDPIASLADAALMAGIISVHKNTYEASSPVRKEGEEN